MKPPRLPAHQSGNLLISQLTARDQEILDALALRVRCLSLAQIARTWWGGTADPVAAARMRLKQLTAAGWVQRFTAMARPEWPLVAPVFVWTPGASAPDFGAVAYQLQSRWRQSAVATPTFIASAAAGQVWGGAGGRLPRQAEQSHDLMMGAIYLHYRQELGAALITQWSSEASIAKTAHPGEKIPDAILQTRAGPLVIECGGAYPKGKLMAFHAYWQTQAQAYVLW